jgi:probable addiction module antidote protein
MPKRTASYKEWLGEQLTDPAIAANYLNEAKQDSPEMFLKALRRVSESYRMSKVAGGAGVSRESLYRMTRESGNPTYKSLNGILNALGLDFVLVPLESATRRKSQRR